MKVLIWIGCCVIPFIVNAIFLEMGMRLGGIPVALLQAGAIWLAIRLCQKLDWHRAMTKATEAGMTVSEYARHGLSDNFLKKLEEARSLPYEQLKSVLKKCVKNGKITKEQYTILLEEYSSTVGVPKQDSPKDKKTSILASIANGINKTGSFVMPYIRKLSIVIIKVIKKIHSFVMPYKKVFLITSIICASLLVASLISYSICDTIMEDAVYHYNITCMNDRTVGCGYYNCKYCEGLVFEMSFSEWSNIRHGRDDIPMRFRYYSKASDAKMFFEVCYVVCALLTATNLTPLTATLVYDKKVKKLNLSNQNTSE